MLTKSFLGVGQCILLCMSIVLPIFYTYQTHLPERCPVQARSLQAGSIALQFPHDLYSTDYYAPRAET